MNPLAIFKGAATLIISAGVGTIVGNTVKHTTNSANLNLLNKVAVGVGAFALSGFIGEKVSQYTVDSVDSALETIEEMKSDPRTND